LPFIAKKLRHLTAFLEGSLSERDCLLPNSILRRDRQGGALPLIASCLFTRGNPIANHQPGQEKIGKGSVREVRDPDTEKSPGARVDLSMMRNERVASFSGI
jgi:hypothetical protein